MSQGEDRVYCCPHHKKLSTSTLVLLIPRQAQCCLHCCCCAPMQYFSCGTVECTEGKGLLNTQCHGAWESLRADCVPRCVLALACVRRAVLLQCPSLGYNQEKHFLEPAGTKALSGCPGDHLPPPSLWLRVAGTVVPEGAGCGDQDFSWWSLAKPVPAFQPALLGWGVFQGRGGGRLPSLWPGRSGPEETKWRFYNWWCSFEISAKRQVAE